jgi:tight adherence protein C
MNTLLNYYYVVLGNFSYFGILALVFMAATTAVFGLLILFSRNSAGSARLSRLMPSTEESPARKPRLLEEAPKDFVAKFARPLHEIVVPKEGATKKSTRLKLIRAGLRSERAFHIFLAVKVLLAILFPASYLATRVFFSFDPQGLILIACLLPIAGYYLPNLYIWLLTKDRQEGIVKALPEALDLMVVCVESGLGLDMTFKRVGDEILLINKNLSEEFRLTNLEIRAGRSRDDGFKDMALRIGVPEVHNLMTVLSQTSRFGTSLAKALRVHADAMRVKRRQRAEEQAAKSTVKLVFPLVVFIFPAIFVVLVGPAAVQIAKVLLPSLSGQGG